MCSREGNHREGWGGRKFARRTASAAAAMAAAPRSPLAPDGMAHERLTQRGPRGATDASRSPVGFCIVRVPWCRHRTCSELAKRPRDAACSHQKGCEETPSTPSTAEAPRDAASSASLRRRSGASTCSTSRSASTECAALNESSTVTESGGPLSLT